MSQSPSSDTQGWIGFSLKSTLAIFIGAVMLVWYVRILLYGDNSLKILRKLQHESATLLQKRDFLRNANQHLQKEYFELLQLNE